MLVDDFLPGRIRFEDGTSHDYRLLARHHYLPRPPSTWALVRVARFVPEWTRLMRHPSEDVDVRARDATAADPPTHADSATHADSGTTAGRVVGVAVLSWPVPMLRARIRHFGLSRSYRENLRFANANLRTISRVVIHPQFRSIGMAAELVRQVIARCPTRYVEASARMGHFVRFFEHAGMTRVPAAPDAPENAPAYFVIDRGVESETRAVQTQGASHAVEQASQ
jgi:GNAT superfamily N-acetyltransferase